jgi:ribulose-phosphate 3-epimerase
VPVRINPSILAADFARVADELARISNADLVHVDVMDNHFVPNLTFGPQMVERIAATSPIPLDVHLMIEDPERWAPGYADLGVASVTFHAEACGPDPFLIAREIRARGARAGLALKPGTPVEPYLEFLTEFDQILIMTVEPGFGGQSFMTEVLPKVARVRAELDRWKPDVWLQVDGGVTRDTIAIAAEAGADTFVAGSAVFRADSPAAEIDVLRDIARAHRHG